MTTINKSDPQANAWRFYLGNEAHGVVVAF
jgi:hypothetical protein